MVTTAGYTVFLLITATERVAELIISRRNASWALRSGGLEFGRSHFPFMVALHAALLLGCLLEPWLLDRPFIPALGIVMLAVALACQALRWWVIATLGPRWNTRVIVLPGRPLVTGGPFRYLRHPNYLAVVCEGIALPLIHSAWMTAVIFTVANAALLVVRVRVENDALALRGARVTNPEDVS